MNATLLISCAILLPCESAESIPESLSKAFARRTRFQTAFFEYEYFAVRGGVVRSPNHRYEARFAGDDVYWTEFGDADGILARDPATGQPVFGELFGCTPDRAVRCNNGKEEWSIHDGDLVLSARPTPKRFRIGGRAPEKLLDPRSAGLYPVASSETSPNDWLQELQLQGYDWSEKIVDGICEVSGSLAKRAAKGKPYRVITWRIDPARDDAIIEIRVYSEFPDGTRKLLDQTQVEHRQFDGHWWPERCVTEADKGRHREEFVFTRVEFDRKEHPSRLGPDILGVPPGARAVDRIHHVRRAGPLLMGRYVGDGQIVTVEEWLEDYKDQHDTPALAAFIAKAQSIGRGAYPPWWDAEDGSFGLENVARTPDLWEVYVRRWIIRHNHRLPNQMGSKAARTLTPAQIEAAWAILKDCRRRADPIVLRMKEEAASVAKSRPDRPIQPQSTMPANDALPARFPSLDRYDKELEQIFHGLKTRLKGLLTSQQDEAEAQETPERDKLPRHRD